MRHALSQHFFVQENNWEFIERPNSTPEVKNLPKNIFISLSHSNELICFAIADSPVGIDLETIKQRNLHDLAEMFMNEEELEYLSKSAEKQTEIFYRTWCAKEAYYKTLPLSEQVRTVFKDISVLSLLHDSKAPFLLEWEIEQFRLAVVIKTIPGKINYKHFPSSIRLWSVLDN